MIGRYRCRCRRKACQARQTIAKHPDEYVRTPRCRNCRKGFLRVDKYRNDGREQRGKTCRCDGHSFPHYRGRAWCTHNEKLTSEDMRRRYEEGGWS